MIRRSAIESRSLSYDPAFEWAEDYAFWASLIGRGGVVHCLPDTLLLYRHSQGQVTSLHYDETPTLIISHFRCPPIVWPQRAHSRHKMDQRGAPSGLRHRNHPCGIRGRLCCRVSYWKRIGGLRGLVQYGCDEQMLSLKTWLEGGECVLLKRVVLGHIYRDNMPYAFAPYCMVHNSLLISELLLPLRERCQALAAACINDRELFMTAYADVRKYLASDPSAIATAKDTLCQRFQRSPHSKPHPQQPQQVCLFGHPRPLA